MRAPRLGWSALVVAIATACDPNVPIGSRLVPDAAPSRPLCPAWEGGTAVSIEASASEVVWSADYETNDTSQWFEAVPGTDGYAAAGARAAITVVTEPVHRATHAAKVELTDVGSGGLTFALQGRRGELPQEAYYSAWFYVPIAYRIDGFAVIAKLETRADRPDGGTSLIYLWDVILGSADGMMTLYVHDHLRQMDLLPGCVNVVPVGRWFRLDVLWRRSSDPDGRFALWMDGQPIVDASGLSTGPAAGWVEWDIGAVADGIAPTDLVLYLDDAAISVGNPAP